MSSCAATQDVTERTVLEEKKMSPKSTTTARSVKTNPADSDLRGGAQLDAAFASKEIRGKRREGNENDSIRSE
ncbi:unnamed protein product [Fusarium graminearum]|uniref:Chromosome 2, complete genome n=2 Tax=Gibberella zeae TaxID=5518 RepID=A0A098DN15_GIBZE|nr:unnamed protein product [Fusarium graminearum]CAF3536198.1 unnamed protein product [Fusarium graminearum]CAF3650109.1 unnamed protein product [Fusarium graminearum]CAG1968098.1 unnamed protein product [Fusarium graminearum]CAG1981401.1 unnamed protein product [Fusarium graminearum]